MKSYEQRLQELLNEDTSGSDALKNIIDVMTVQFPGLYERMKVIAEKSAKAYDPADHERGRTFRQVINFVLSGQRAAWYKDVFFNYLKPSLYTLSKTLPKHLRADLVEFLSTDTVEQKFGAIETVLIPVLHDIALATKNSKLKVAIDSAHEIVTEFRTFLSKLEKVAYGDYTHGDARKPVKDKESQPNVIAQQNANVEAIINDVLGRIDKRQAGDIRTVIARSANKLATLQQELNKRGIRI